MECIAALDAAYPPDQGPGLDEAVSVSATWWVLGIVHLADNGAYVDDEPALTGSHVRNDGLADA